MAVPPARDRPAWIGGRLVSGVDDVRRVLAATNAAGLRRENVATAAALAVQTADEAQQAATGVGHALPLAPELAGLLPLSGLRRGATVAAVGSTSLLMTLLAGAMRGGAWAAVVGLPAWGSLAAAEHGIPLDRLALIPQPGPDWPTIVAAAIDGLDIVVVAAPVQASEPLTRALRNRARQRGAVLMTTTVWPGAELTLEVTDRRWVGLNTTGHGRLRRWTSPCTRTAAAPPPGRAPPPPACRSPQSSGTSLTTCPPFGFLPRREQRTAVGRFPPRPPRLNDIQIDANKPKTFEDASKVAFGAFRSSEVMIATSVG